MGSTFVEYHGRGFEANDATLEIWLLLLVDAIGELPNPPDWLRKVSEDWRLQATAAFGFGVMPGLDEIVTNSERRDIILDLGSKAMKRLHDYGPVISKDQLNAMLKGGEQNMFTADASTKYFEWTGDYFIKLLCEDLRPEESDARFWQPRDS